MKTSVYRAADWFVFDRDKIGFLFIVIGVVAVGGAVYYFKILRPRKQAAINSDDISDDNADDDMDDDDYGDAEPGEESDTE